MKVQPIVIHTHAVVKLHTKDKDLKISDIKNTAYL